MWGGVPAVRVIAVLAGNNKQFREFVFSQQHLPIGEASFTQIRSVDDIRGRFFDEAFRVGTWWEIKGLEEIEAHLRMRVHTSKEQGMTSSDMPRMSPGQARQLMREIKDALKEAEKLIKKYGEDSVDGAVIRFVKEFNPSYYGGAQSGPRPSEAIGVVLTNRAPITDTAAMDKFQRSQHSFAYAAIRAHGKWFATGGASNTPQGVDWEDLLEWMADGIPVSEVEWLSRGFAAGEVEAVPAPFDGEKDDDGE